MRFVLALILLADGALADCPPPPDIAVSQDALLAEARALPSADGSREISAKLWELWAQAPDEVAQALLDRGMEARSSYDFLAASDAFDRLVAYCPGYAEGYNQRAFVNFLREDFAAALIDLERAIELRPGHVAAISGKALTLMGLGRHDEAQEVLREAVEQNPWIPERGLLEAPVGEDL